jgi:hypothetical protein
MILETGDLAEQFLFWEYLFRIFGMGSLQYRLVYCRRTVFYCVAATDVTRSSSEKSYRTLVRLCRRPFNSNVFRV